MTGRWFLKMTTGDAIEDVQMIGTGDLGQFGIGNVRNADLTDIRTWVTVDRCVKLPYTHRLKLEIISPQFMDVSVSRIWIKGNIYTL